MATIPNDAFFPDQWALHNTGQLDNEGQPGLVDADIDAPEAWDITTGTGRVVVAVIDSELDYTHPDIYLNIWINEEEIPSYIHDALTDIDGNGRINFRDLQAPINRGPSMIEDYNNNGYIDGGDLLHEDSYWTDGIDTDMNGYTDDLIGWDFAHDGPDPMSMPYSDDSYAFHGLHVAGIIGAMGDRSPAPDPTCFGGPCTGDIAGINWNVELMPLRFITQGDTQTAGDANEINQRMAKALHYAISEGADVSNISGGGGGISGLTASTIISWELALTRAHDNGHIIVAAAGNAGVNTDNSMGYPLTADYDNIIGVAGTDRSDELWSDSNYGVVHNDLAAPATSIYTLDADNGLHKTFGGTSAAVPHVTGVISLIQDRHPGWTYKQVVDQVLWSTEALDSLQNKVATGGRLNAASALVPERELLFSTRESGQLTGSDGVTVTFEPSDILQLSVYEHPNTGQEIYRYSMYFDGSDVGLDTSAEDIDAFTVMEDGSMLISVRGVSDVISNPGVQPWDVVRFFPHTLGQDTSGTWELYVRGESVGLGVVDQFTVSNIDGLHALRDGDLVMSTSASVDLPSTKTRLQSDDEDLVRLHPTGFGYFSTSGTWSMYFDASDVGVPPITDTDAVFVGRESSLSPPDLFLSSTNAKKVVGNPMYSNADVYRFDTTGLGASTSGSWADGAYLDANLYGLAAFNIDAVHLQYEVTNVVVGPILKSGGELLAAAVDDEAQSDSLSNDASDPTKLAVPTTNPASRPEIDLYTGWIDAPFRLESYETPQFTRTSERVEEPLEAALDEVFAGERLV